MLTTQKAALCLIKNAVTGTSDPLPEGFRLPAVIELMFAQGLGAMCYVGAKNYNLFPGSKVMEYLEDQYCMTAVHSQHQVEQISRICHAFEEKQLAYMPVKGAIMKGLYPDHAMRTMCDADILIHQEEYDRIRPVMEQLGFRETGESDHEHIWKNDFLTVELHKRLMPSYNKDYYSYFGEGWDLAKVQKGCCWAMTHEDAFIYDTIHFAKHYRDANVNARFLVDLWIHMRVHPDLDLTYIRNQMRRLRMETFYDNILHVIAVWFEGGAWDDKVRRITDVLFNTDKEQKKENIAIAQNTKAAQTAGSVSKAKKSRLIHKIFPTKEQLGYSYPQWKKVPLVFAWIMRWFSLLFRRQDGGGRDRSRQVTEEAVENYRQELEYIGLEFSDQVVLPD